MEQLANGDVVSTLLRHFVAHAQYDAALLFTQGQYVLYQRAGNELACKGVSSQTLRAAFVQEAVDSGWLTQGVVRWGSGPAGTFIVKFIPPGPQKIILSGKEGPLTITPLLPALIYAGVNDTYYVWAVEGNICDPDAQLYHAPFPNVYKDGHICFGGNHPPIVGWKSLGEAWRLFLDAPFNADLAQGKSLAHSSDVRLQLLALAQSQEAYPEQDLVPYVGGDFGFFRSDKEVRTLNEAVEHYLLKKEKE